MKTSAFWIFSTFSFPSSFSSINNHHAQPPDSMLLSRIALPTKLCEPSFVKSLWTFTPFIYSPLSAQDGLLTHSRDSRPPCSPLVNGTDSGPRNLIFDKQPSTPSSQEIYSAASAHLGHIPSISYGDVTTRNQHAEKSSDKDSEKSVFVMDV